MAQTTVKDFAKTLKISEEALLKRMSSAGLSHSSKSDEVTTAHKQILLRSLKQKQKQTSSSISSSSGVGIKVKSCLLYTSPSPRDSRRSRMPSSA